MAVQEGPQIPKQHKACVYDNPGTLSVAVEMVDTPEPGPGEVLVNLTHSGVCHSDLGIMTNSWAMLPHPTPKGQVGGHEGVGKIVKLGPGANKSNVKIGDRVGIKWVSAICGSCGPCLEGLEGVCQNNKVSGYYTPGTYQQYVLGPADYVTPIPDRLSSSDAAPMLCAGLTTYSALEQSKAKPGQWIVVSGAGGGLGHIAVQLAARGMAMRVIGLDAPSKKDLIMECGAEAFLDVFAHDDASIAEEVKKITGGRGAHAAIVCTANNKAYAQSLMTLGYGGTLVCVGLPEGKPEAIATAYPMMIVFKMLTICGAAVGNRRQAQEVLDMAARGLVKTRIRTEKMENLKSVFEEMEHGKLQGRVVLDLS